jgi:hypothetical protein
MNNKKMLKISEKLSRKAILKKGINEKIAILKPVIYNLLSGGVPINKALYLLEISYEAAKDLK